MSHQSDLLDAFERLREADHLLNFLSDIFCAINTDHLELSDSGLHGLCFVVWGAQRRINMAQAVIKAEGGFEDA